MNHDLKYRHTQTRPSSGHAKEKSPLLTLRNCKTGEHFRLNPKRKQISIGGAKDCDLVIRDPYASAQHCTLKVTQSNVWHVLDQSKNGTRINGMRIEAAELRPGSEIAIGNTKLELISKGPSTDNARSQLVGESPAFLEAIQMAIKAARSNCSILLLGETGTGKELFARLIHESSRRTENNYVPVNCGAIPADLVRSELFGHIKGSFTGATSTQEGHFHRAHLGTLFLDELGELPKVQQPQLLRALESGLIRKVGGPLEELVDVRIVAATNRTCLDSRFSPLRKDLFHRISGIVIKLPSLKERKEDIPLLVNHFLSEKTSEYGQLEVSQEVLEQLSKYPWPGNIRELRNRVYRAMAMHSGTIKLEDFLPEGMVLSPSPSSQIVPMTTEELSAFQQNQQELILESYQRLGSIRATAIELGVPKSTLADLCRQLGIDTSKKKR